MVIVSAPCGPISEYTTSLGNLNDNGISNTTSSDKGIAYRSCDRGRTCTASRPEVTRGTMLEWVMFIPNLTEEVYAIGARKERCSDRVNGGVTVALFIRDLIAVGMSWVGERRGAPRSRSRRADRGG